MSPDSDLPDTHPTPTPPLPRFAQIEPTGRCNLECRMCTVHERGDAVADLSFEAFRSLLDQMPGLEQLHLQGLGEPMMNPRFFDMVAEARRRGIHVSSNSNLTLLTPARARRLVECGLAVLSISLDGASKAVYESIRHRASFDKVLRNLDRLVEARRAAGSGLELRGVMVLMRTNLEELPALVRLLHQHGVNELLVQRLSSDLEQPDLASRYFPIRDYVRSAELRCDELPHAGQVFARARALADSMGFGLHLPRLEPPEKVVGGCRWPWDQLYLSAAGELMPCCMVASADRASFGRVSDSLLGVWRGERAQAFRRALASDTPPAVCRSCALYRGAF